MIVKSVLRRSIVSLVIVGLVPSTMLPAYAFTGGVTTVYSNPTPTTIQRARTFAAVTPELNQTYQRTMRTAQTAAAVATASRGIIRGMLGSLMTIATLATLASDVHGIWTKKADNTNDLIGQLESCNPTCYEYAASGQTAYQTSPAAACSAFIATIKDPDYTYTYVSSTVNQCTIKYASNKDGSGATVSTPIVSRPAPPRTTETVFTDQDIETALQQNNRQLPILKTLDEMDLSVPFPAPEVEDMPQPIVISPTTITNPDGSKTIQQTTLEPYRSTPDGPVQWRKKDAVTEISAPAPDGTTTSKTSTTTTDKGQQSTPEKAPEAPATDTALPEQPKLYTKKYPDGMTGVWRDQRSAMANSPLFTLPRMLMPSSVGSGGSCPVMNVNLTFSQWANFGTKDVAPPCYVWDWGKAICIVSACLLARRLIFGG